jgi:hypothetical protein
MRDLHSRLLGAVLDGGGLQGLAELASIEAGGPVAIALPSRGLVVSHPEDPALEGAEVELEVPVIAGEREIGAVRLLASSNGARPQVDGEEVARAAALVEGEWPGALADLIEGRVYAILPARGGDEAPERSQGEARRLVGRLRSHGPAAASSFYADPAELHQAVREAELMLDVARRDERLAEQIEASAGDGVYRLLFRALISDPNEMRSFYQETVAPVIEHDRQYRSDLLATLESYLANDCNMNATARAIFAHRHTVAYRLDRVRELTGLDPGSGDDRERLGLGIKAYRILAPGLPK